MNRNLNDLSEELHKFQTEAGFTNSDISQRLMLVMSEVSEAFEAYRKDKFCSSPPIYGMNNFTGDSFKKIFEAEVKDTMEDEIADTIIRLLAFCGENNIDIENHIEWKMKYNKLRGFKYGGKKF